MSYDSAMSILDLMTCQRQPTIHCLLLWRRWSGV